MRGESNSRQINRVIGRIASAQHGLVSHRQLLAAGITPRQIELRIANGQLYEIHRGVYLVGHTVRSPHAHEMAALLAYDLKAVLSHRSAGTLWDLLPYPASAPVWVTIPPERSATRPRIKAVRAHIDRRDLRIRDGMRVTSPPRTILDLASLVDADRLEAVVAEAEFRGRTSVRELLDQLTRNRGKRGTARLRKVLGIEGGPQRTRSAPERRMLLLLRGAGIKGFETNHKIHGYEVDFYWPREGLVVEVDSPEAHGGLVAFERDRLKAATLEAAGLVVMSVTERQIDTDPDGVLRRLDAALRTRLKD